MLQSPPKRRKLNTDSTGRDNGPSSTPSRRASYLSPTKSSLSRSHPHLVPQSSRRSLTESRGKLLRNEILKGRATEVVETADDEQKGPDTEPSTPTQTNEEGVGATTGNVSFDLNGSLSKEQPASEQLRVDQTSPSKNASPPSFTPDLGPRKRMDVRHAARAPSDEYDLPPTPVELGLSPAPPRPRGLAASSSPRSSRSSTGSRRRRTRLETASVSTSSPLKQKLPAPVELEPGMLDVAEEQPQEAPESEPEAVSEDEVRPHEAPESEPEAARHQDDLEEQRAILDSLRLELKQLRHEHDQLQSALEDEEALDDATVALLQKPDERTSRKLMYSADDDQMLEHLARFAPGSLQLRSTTESIIDRGRPEIIHTLIVEAPSPWLPNAFTFIFKVEVDAQAVQIQNVYLGSETVGSGRQRRPNKSELYGWLNARLSHPVHKFDVSSLVWGTGRWFDAATERAKVFHWMENKYNKHDESEAVDSRKEDLDRDTCIELARYLSVDSHAVMDESSTNTSTIKPITKKIMLTWQIRLDWASNPISNIQISTSNSPKTAEPGLQTVFAEIMLKAGVKRAFESVWELMQESSEDLEPVATTAGTKAKAKAKKRRF